MLLLLFSWGTFLWEQREGEKRDGGIVGTVQRCEICVVLGFLFFFLLFGSFFCWEFRGGRERGHEAFTCTS